MIKTLFVQLISLVTISALSGIPFFAQAEEPGFTIIPKPLSLKESAGAFSVDAQTSVIADTGARDTATYLAQRLRKVTGFNLPVRRHKDDDDTGTIVLRLLESPAQQSDQDKEAYQLRVTSDLVDISATDPAGLFYGVQTLLQMFPPDIYAKEPRLFGPDELSIPGVDITDRPRFSWRGLMIDVSRHFFSKEQLLKTIDAMAVHKLNVLHLHLTDDPGWRVEIDRYPKLINVGAVGDMTNPDGPERLYYSKDELREIIAYAGQRHIMVVPEIDMPGHSMAAAKAYPEYFDGYMTYNPGNEQTFEFVRNVLTEVMELFPSGYLHFGGDEVRNTRWAELPEIAVFMEDHGYTDLHEVEGHFDRFVADFIVEQGYTPIGWDEIVNFDVNPASIVQWWLHLRPEALDKAIRKGHRVIISPTNYLYFDYPNHVGEPGALWEGNDNGANSVELIYQWEPIPDTFTPEQEALVIGLQANLWTEFITTNDYYEFMIFPRLSSLAEIAWSPKGHKDLDNFRKRIDVQCKRYEAMDINYRVNTEWPTDFRYLRH